jgi:hypothetical protein
MRKQYRALVLSFVALTACGSSSSGSGDSTGDDASTGPGADGGPAGDGSPPTHDGGSTTGDSGSDGSQTGNTDGGPGNTSSAASWFSSQMYFNIPVDTAQVDSASSTIINAWVANGGWGEGHIQVDFSIDVYYADASSVRAPFMQNSNLITPDSDIPATIPIAPNTTGSSPAPGFECNPVGSTSCDDCHYLVVDAANHQLIEVYGATTDGTTFSTSTAPSNCGRSVAIWDWTKTYPGNLRGDVCTSADASGGLMAPTLFTVEEVAAGHIDHAIRFILPNTMIQTMQYVRPVTHGTGGDAPDWAQTNGVPYGARFRLNPMFDVSTYSTGAQVVLNAMKKYGIILQDGGNIALTAKSDTFSTLKWASYLGSHDLEGPEPTDFQMVDVDYGSDMEPSSTLHNFTSYTCTRNP